MNRELTFVIAVPDERAVANWTRSMELLRETTDAALAQSGPKPLVVVAASRGARLPSLPGVEVADVDREYAPLPKAWDVARQKAIRADKGARITTGLIQAQPTGHVMVTDWDDLVSDRLSARAAEASTEPGWIVDEGVIFSPRGMISHVRRGMNQICGTTLIIRADLLRIPSSPADIDEDWASQMYGSHINAVRVLREQGEPLSVLPFAGVAYRVGTGTNGSYRSHVWSTSRIVLSRKEALRSLRPRSAMKSIVSLK